MGNMRPASSQTCVPGTAKNHGVSCSATSCAVILVVSSFCSAASAQCHRDGAYDLLEIASSAFFTTREQTKFAPSERSYPVASGATARYCFSRGCTGQLTVKWTADEQLQLRALRAAVVQKEDASSELHFIRVATLQMESWLYARLRSLDPATVNQIMRNVANHYGGQRSEDANWITSALSTFDRFDKECATYAMEATQHLLVLANLRLLRHWNVTAPVYRYGVPGHWTAGLENRETCERYRFDLNTRASARYSLHIKGKDPAMLALEGKQNYGHLLPGMDGNGVGRSTGRRRPDTLTGGFALNGPQLPAVTTPR